MMFNSSLWATKGKHFQSVMGYGNLSTLALGREREDQRDPEGVSEGNKVFMSRNEKKKLKGRC